MSVIHRYGMSGGTQCGAGRDAFGHLKISTTGARVTCPACLKLDKRPTREEALESLKRAIS